MQTSRSTSLPAFFYLVVTAALLAAVILAAGIGWLAVTEPAAAQQASALLVIGFAAVVVFIDPLAGFLLWLLLSLFSPFLPFDLKMPAGVPDLSFTRMVAGVMVLYLLSQIARGKWRLASITAIEVALPFFVLALVLAAARASNGVVWGVQAVFDSYVVPLLAYVFARHLIQERQSYQRLSHTLLLAGGLIAVFAIVEQLTGFSPFRTANTSLYYTGEIRKVAALLGNPAYIAVTLAIILPLAIVGLFESVTRGRRWLFAALATLLLAGIYLTYNRSGWLAGALVMVIMGVGYRPFRRPALLMLAVGGLAMLLSWSTLQDTAAGERLFAQSPVDYRVQAFETGIDIVQRAPLTGIGWGSFGRIAASSGFRVGANVHVLPSTHNSYLNFLVSGGVLLLTTYLFLLGAVTWVLLRATLALRRGGLPPYILACWAAFAAYVVPAAAFDNNFAIYANLVFWSLVGGTISVALAAMVKPSAPPVPAGMPPRIV